jgi:hypothetical protein
MITKAKQKLTDKIDWTIESEADEKNHEAIKKGMLW